MEKKDEEMTGALRQDMNYLNDRLKVDKSFDLIYRTIEIGGREACMYFIDGFVETIVFNTALLRRIRSTDLRVEMYAAGKSSHTDIAVCYMESRVDKKLLNKIVTRIQNIRVDALTMNQESLAECLYEKKCTIRSRNSNIRNAPIRQRRWYWGNFPSTAAGSIPR